MLTVADLKDVVSRGGGIEIDAGSFRVSDMKDLASRTQGNSGSLVIAGAGALSASDIKDLASRGRGSILFRF